MNKWPPIPPPNVNVGMPKNVNVRYWGRPSSPSKWSQKRTHRIPNLQLELTPGHKCPQQYLFGYNTFPSTLPRIHQTHSSSPLFSHPTTIFPWPILVDQSLHRRFAHWLRNWQIDFLQSIALTLNTYDISQNSVLPGIGCNAQGFFINIGDVSSAWWTLVITLHTFLIIAGGNKVRIWVIEKSKSGKLRWIFAITLWICAFFLSTVGLFLIQYVEKKGPFCIFHLRKCLI